MRNRVAVAFVLFLSLCGSAFAADEYKIDAAHSSAQFTVKHLMVSNVTGRFREMTGTILLDDKDPSRSSVNVVIKTASVTTDNDRRDTHLRSDSFFDVEKYPDIRFVSTKVTKQGEQWVAVGNFTMKDVTREITLPFSLAKAEIKGKNKIGVEAGAKLDRYEYHVDFDKTGATVSGEVRIELNLEANGVVPVPAASATPAAATSAKK